MTEAFQFEVVETPKVESPPKVAPKPAQRGRRSPKRGTDSGIAGGNRESETPEAQFDALEDSEGTAFGVTPIPDRAIVEKPDRLNSKSQVKKGPPSLTDWQDFFSRFVIKILVDIYLNVVLGDLVMDLSPQERDMIKLSAEDMSDIAAPLAVMTEKTSFGKKHGRSIIAMADSYESVITLLFWMRRVNRVARKHKPVKQRKQRPAAQGVVIPQEETNAFTDGHNQRDGERFGVNGYEYPVFNPGSG